MLFINNGDLENDGEVFLSGELDIDGSLLNEDYIESAAGQPSLLSLEGDWTNNGVFVANIGDILMDGAIQNVGGISPELFYNVKSIGSMINQKILLKNLTVSNQMDIGAAYWEVGDFYLDLNNPRLAILEKGGFFHTNYAGRVRLISGSANIIPFSIPFGYNAASPVKRKLSFENPPAGIYSTAFIEGTPSTFGTDANSHQDSICRLMEDHFWFLWSNQNTSIALEIKSAEKVFTRVSKWQTFQWEQRPPSVVNHSIPFNYKATDMASNDSGYYALNSESPFVLLEPAFESFANKSRAILSTSFIPNGSSILWTPDDQLSCNNCLSPIFDSKISALLKVQIENDGCIAEDDVFITVLERDEVFMQNAFTPDYNGINETFYPVLLDHETLLNMKIFNRWGEKVFEGIAPWDGTYLGSLVPSGGYVYHIDIRRDIGERDVIIHLRGVVQVLR
jgi:gliding motility-associated-like protein